MSHSSTSVVPPKMSAARSRRGRIRSCPARGDVGRRRPRGSAGRRGWWPRRSRRPGGISASIPAHEFSGVVGLAEFEFVDRPTGRSRAAAGSGRLMPSRAARPQIPCRATRSLESPSWHSISSGSDPLGGRSAAPRPGAVASARDPAHPGSHCLANRFPSPRPRRRWPDHPGAGRDVIGRMTKRVRDPLAHRRIERGRTGGPRIRNAGPGSMWEEICDADGTRRVVRRGEGPSELESALRSDCPTRSRLFGEPADRRPGARLHRR